ncbi:hypothetical protein VTK26DRAFT_4608 [Humicola hyalothermophila]
MAAELLFCWPFWIPSGPRIFHHSPPPPKKTNLSLTRVFIQPEEDPADHCHLARAVDEFERAAWFWPSVEAFFEDDHNPADGMAVSQDWLEGCRRGGKGFAAAAAATTITTTTDAAAPSSSVVGQDVATIAAGIDAMVLDGAEELGEEMDLDK